MMSFVRLLVPFGLMGFGAIAAFMGIVVLINSLSTGRVSLSFEENGKTVTSRVSKSEDAQTYWRSLGFAGGLPAAIGLGAVWWGRRMLRS
jgi:hypothetical protein